MPKKSLISIECQQCGWTGDESELIAPFSDWEPVCPDCWSSDFLDNEKEKIMNFIELKKLADRIVEKTEKYTSIAAEYDKHPSGSSDLEYRFYQPDNRTKFKTVQELKYHMENILNPPADEGVDINDLAEDGILRGAE